MSLTLVTVTDPHRMMDPTAHPDLGTTLTKTARPIQGQVIGAGETPAQTGTVVILETHQMAPQNPLTLTIEAGGQGDPLAPHGTMAVTTDRRVARGHIDLENMSENMIESNHILPLEWEGRASPSRTSWKWTMSAASCSGIAV